MQNSGEHARRLARRPGRWTALGLVAAMSATVLGGPALAGGSTLDADSGSDDDMPFFGFVKDQNGDVVEDAKVTAEFKGGNGTLVTRSDANGHYQILGFSKNVDPEQVQISCSKDGYRFTESQRRNPGSEPGAPVEVDCLLSHR